jgi:shikimate kinase
MRSPIALVGFMGSGKSAVGIRLAARLEVPFLDLDERIEAVSGRTVEDLFTRSGEAEFRRLEGAALESALAELASGGVLACGGGLFARPENRARLVAGGIRTVWLDAPLADIEERIEQPATRPLFTDPQSVAELYRQRSVLYARADLRVDASGNDLERVVERVVAALEAAPD